MILRSESDVHHIIKLFLGILALILIAVVLYAALRIQEEVANMPVATNPIDIVKNTDKLVLSSPEPLRVNFGMITPSDFPTDIPLEKDTKFEQSYSLGYPERKQLSVVFSSAKTVKENYALYAEFLKKQNWSISNRDEKSVTSFLYATKDGTDMNVTISGDKMTPQKDIAMNDAYDNMTIFSVQSKVSISILKK